MQYLKYRDIIKKRALINDEWYSEVEKCWSEMAELFSTDINETIKFLDVCTEEEFTWLSEVFDRIAVKTHSSEFIAALYRTADKYPEATKEFNIMSFIHSAECIVQDE